MSLSDKGALPKTGVLARLSRELRGVIPAIIYFFIAFSLFNLTFGRMMQQAGMQASSFSRTLVMSLVAGKVILVANNLPFFNLFPNKPLLYNTLWKASIYTFFNFLVRVAENLIRLMPQSGDVASAWHHLLSQVTPLRVFTVQVWFFTLFLMFIIAEDMFDMVGREKLRKIYFGF